MLLDRNNSYFNTSNGILKLKDHVPRCRTITFLSLHSFSYHQTGTHTVYKKECLTPLCDTCSVGNYCANRGETYTYTVSCVRTNTFGYSGFTSGTATKTVSLSFFADVNPPFAYDSSSKLTLTCIIILNTLIHK